ncbi:MerR family transcriptional regulator [uncultured Agrobacterium sp.]|uniref:MerR family transcriptional regulator n=1 Tax=uncultured Agrobacterium sp. TaxID=157277 RepID=UPI0025830884|nr:MerR family transcriptional regulator [uncultured Agrobacterium sp.]
MKIGELARRSGLSAYTIRYYERIGLLPYADRDRSSRRDYDPSILVWIAFLGRLKTTGMPIRDMLRYAALRTQGDDTVRERQAILEAHREQVRAQIENLQDCLLVLDQKIAGYAGDDQRMKDYDAVSTPSGRKQAGTRTTRAR